MKALKPEEIKFLKKLEIFHSLTYSELAILSGIAKVQSIAPQTQILKEGATGQNIYIFLTGEASVCLSKELLIFPSIKAGEITGEFSFFTNQPCTANVVTSLPSKVICLNHTVLKKTLRKHPHLGLKLYINFSREILRKFTLLSKQASYLILGNSSRQIAHDIRSPLAALKIIAENMPKNRRNDAELISLVVERIDKIAATLLNEKDDPESSRHIEDRTKDVTAEELSNYLQKVIIEKRLHLRNQNRIDIIFKSNIKKTTNSSFLVKLNPLDLDRIISNLIDNSIQAIPNDGMIEVHLKVTKSSFVISVQDNGIGISKKVLTQIGQVRVSHGKATGHGMGLFYAYHQLKLWGGKLEIESKLKKGTSIILSLPRST